MNEQVTLQKALFTIKKLKHLLQESISKCIAANCYCWFKLSFSTSNW